MYYQKLDEFPQDFLWGAASAAYQIEGAFDEAGKGRSIWDTYAHTPGNTYQGTTGDVAVDHYHHMEEDVALMGKMGLKAYRFSVAWSRVIPDGEGAVNEAGLDFYRRLIKALRANHVEPVLTLYHWDLPQALQDKYQGWESRETIAAFKKYCQVLFAAFKDDVKYWVTFNEQNVFTSMGYRWGTHPPKVMDIKRMYAANHIINLANAEAINLFHEMVPNGLIGPSFGYGPVYPLTGDPNDVLASVNADDFNNNWWLDVYCRGEYPFFMMKQLQRMGIAPVVTAADEQLLKSAKPDFLGVNYYHGGTVQTNRLQKPVATDQQAKDFSATDPYLMQPKADQAQSPEIPAFNSVASPYLAKTEWGWEIDPVGFRVALRQVYEKYRLPIFVTENGLGAVDQLVNGQIDDQYRIDYLQAHLLAMKEAITDGVAMIGYCAWSYTDLLSWLNGYRKRYGFVYIDRDDNGPKELKRIPKASYYWYQQIIAENGQQIGAQHD
ncbi:glycoside hydrolase family 1 protein [Lapidilactobacillus achengensis]|uniref:Glycoside hydrolase family 1 protein n=1 Tax=Lapidilactobacillus achengensis TaxID=2486000 RepID=A0ABW1USV7_9LACO|nr:glycoside hydrolase family 1 protein [Lapidilactobacillus achengensis]